MIFYKHLIAFEKVFIKNQFILEYFGQYFFSYKKNENSLLNVVIKKYGIKKIPCDIGCKGF